MKIEKPIFIFGFPRSGTTIFYKMLAEHPNVAWLSRIADLFPQYPSINGYIMKTYSVPFFGATLQKMLSSKIKPGERYDFWEYYAKGFKNPCRDLTADDVTNKSKEQIAKAMAKVITKKRNRLLIKVTGWPRVGYINKIFPDAKFIHIVRDGRAVINSLINVDFWWGWRGPSNWRWGDLSPSLNNEWLNYNKSFIALAGIQFKIYQNSLKEVKKVIDKKNFTEIKYEDLCLDHKPLIERITEFCELENTKQFKRSIGKYILQNSNYKWKAELTKDQQKIVEEIIADFLKSNGYM